MGIKLDTGVKLEILITFKTFKITMFAIDTVTLSNYCCTKYLTYWDTLATTDTMSTSKIRYGMLT